MSILEYYKYAQLATATYVRVGNSPLDGATFAVLAASNEQERLPLSLAQNLFDPANAFGATVWSVLHYYGGDNTNDSIASADKSGFAATSFEKEGEKVLTMRGTEPNSDARVDLFGADIAEIGLLGMAFSQTVSMVNLINRLRTPNGQYAHQVKVVTSLEPPSDPLLLTD